MPVGNPKPQSVATRKYEQKTGYVSKSYKLKKELVEQFAKACDKAGVGQATQLTKMMKEFIEEQNKKNNRIASKRKHPKRVFFFCLNLSEVKEMRR